MLPVYIAKQFNKVIQTMRRGGDLGRIYPPAGRWRVKKWQCHFWHRDCSIYSGTIGKTHRHACPLFELAVGLSVNWNFFWQKSNKPKNIHLQQLSVIWNLLSQHCSAGIVNYCNPGNFRIVRKFLKFMKINTLLINFPGLKCTMKLSQLWKLVACETP